MCLCFFSFPNSTWSTVVSTCVIRNDPLQGGCTFADGSSGACPLSETVDAKAQEDGLAVEAVQVGVACGHLIAVACGENNGICILWDISQIESPVLLKTFNLSPASRDKNPEQTYLKDLGDLDSETILFLTPEESPTGKEGLVFGGAISGTLSFYEFQCESHPDDDEDGSSSNPSLTKSAETKSSGEGDDGLSTGGIVGIVIASVAAVGVVAYLVTKNNGKDIEHDTGASGVNDVA